MFQFPVVMTCIVFTVLSLSGCGGSSSGSPSLTGTPPGTSTPPATSGGAVSVPSSGAYFGAWVMPVPGSTSVEAATEVLESQIGRKLALHMHYYGWGNGITPSFPDASMQSDLSEGRTPVVTWGCGDQNVNVASGADDQLIIKTAEAVKQFGAPIFLRWYWEMNLGAGVNNQDCMGTGGAAGYIAAWQHIHNIFTAQGVTNVSWLWNPAGTPGRPDPAPYYPGSNYVDWIGFDGYDKIQANDFGGVFSNFYTEFSSYNKPILIAETGECPTEQAAYLESAQTEIEGKTNPGGYSFPLVKGFMYFDAPGSNSTGTCIWTLSSTGLPAFTAMGADQFFQQKP